MAAFDDLLDQYRAMSDSERMKGNYFEQMVKQYLLLDGVQAPQYKNVWLWKDWPDRDGQPDLGIDLVADREDGGITAIQCKFYAAGHKIQKSEIDSFMSNSGKKPYTHRLIVDTTGADWSPNAEQMLEGQYLPVTRIGLTELRNSNIDWTSYQLEVGNKPKLQLQKQLRPHQHPAVKDVIEGFASADRGKLIMACGTGKTFTSLRIAEHLANDQSHLNVLFLVPSLALMSQTLKEWADNASIPMHAYAVCSDIKVGRASTGELTDIQVHDLQIPATTNGTKLAEAQQHRPLAEGMTVVFSTYQSIDGITEAQSAGYPEFDLIICDEAHRTAGVTLASDAKVSPFVKIHDNSYVAGAKRLYMTATPRVFNDNIKEKAAEKDAYLYSMDSVELFGDTFYRIGFGQAVSEGILTDYKVLVLGVDVKEVADLLSPAVLQASTELAIDDLAKLIGCWNGLAKRRAGSLESDFGVDTSPMRRALAFNKDIATSKLVAQEFEDLVRIHLSDLTNEDPTDDLRVEVKHVDGNDNALVRGERLDWLKAEPGRSNPVCRVLTNARCLTEGVDVPSLDAVMFLNPRNSQVDVIQSVGRVMRSFKDPETGDAKRFGYIILPIAIPEGASPEDALRDNDRYRVVWQVLQALRSHDERMDNTINQLELNDGRPENIVVEKVSLTPRRAKAAGFGHGSGGDSESWSSGEADDASATVGPVFVPVPLTFPAEEWKDAVYAKIVRECGNRMYWLDWASDIADIAGKHILLIQSLLQQATPLQQAAFATFVSDLQGNLNPEIDEAQAVEMLAQHLVTKPVFDAMFTTANFTESNVVSVAMQRVLDELATEDVFAAERAGLEKFYSKVQQRVANLNSVSAKQSVIIELYDHFFKKAFPRTAKRLGIVFTPVPVVNYILRSADDALQLTFGKSLSDEGVSILEPFAGTGTFITQLLRSGLIRPADLERKFKHEIFANEIVLLSYYIASINIESVYGEVAKEVLGLDGYVPFEGIALTDTFQLNEHDNAIASVALPENSARLQRQKDADIRVIVMNPPYSVGQKSSNDDNANIKYNKLDRDIADTYVRLAGANLLKSAYDSYYRAIRWASNRIKENGVIAFVSNGGFIDSATAQGIRKAFMNEFSSVFIYNLRGAAAVGGVKGDARRREGGNVFGDGTKTGVAIAILVKEKDKVGDAQLFYRDIGDTLTREEKVDILIAEGSLAHTQWEQLTPDLHGDWINLRDTAFSDFQPLGDKATKGTTETAGIFRQFSLGLSTNRDSWVYNFSSGALRANLEGSIAHYNSIVQAWTAHRAITPKVGADDHLDFIPNDDPMFAWEVKNKTDLKQGRFEEFHPEYVRPSMYRPFVREYLYFDPTGRLTARPLRVPSLLPTNDHDNLCIAVSSDKNTGVSALVTSLLPNLHLVGDSQVFAFYTYEPISAGDGTLSFSIDGGEIVGDFIRRENITDTTLESYRRAYADQDITKWDIFHYVYAVLHHPEYRERFSSDLQKQLARIPQLQDFQQFATVGKKLIDLHVGYETVDPYPLEEIRTIVEPEDRSTQFDYYRVDGSMSWKSRRDRSELRINRNITLKGFPEEAQDYQLAGKSALEWVRERYAVKQDAKSGLWNDANDYGAAVDDPRYIIGLVGRVAAVSVETVRLVEELPPYAQLEEQGWQRSEE